MPTITITAESYATIRATAIARACSHEAVVVDLLRQALPPFDPDELAAHEFGGLLVVFYRRRFAGIVLNAVPPSRDVNRAQSRSGRGASTSTEWCPWFAPLVAGRRLCV